MHTYLAAAAAPTRGVAATATTAAATGPTSSAAASGFLREILTDLGLELVLAAAVVAAILWGEVMAKALAPAAAPPPTGEEILPANGDAAAATGVATALEDAWRGVVMSTAPATICAGGGHSRVISGGDTGCCTGLARRGRGKEHYCP
jgi:hypothetical protein